MFASYQSICTLCTMLSMYFICISYFFFLSRLVIFFFFFFQAEDGIRDLTVTGVQTCALPISRALDYTCQICNAMDHAHKHGVIHRDLRPGNVLVTEQGMIKVADFGTSRFLEIAAHGTTVIGSPPYMAPEQFQGKAVFASDIYSLGVTMYQMFTGVLPYDTPMPGDMDKLMRGELASPPILKNPKLPKGISDIEIGRASCR